MQSSVSVGTMQHIVFSAIIESSATNS